MITTEQIKTLNFDAWKCRCSSISNIMTSPAADKLPVGAITHIEREVDKILYGFTTEIHTKEMTKGTNGEDESIEVHNAVNFTNYKKHVGSASNEYLITAGCDIDDQKNDKVIEIKTPWSKETFPKTKRKAFEVAKKSGYSFQAQGYMSIFGRSKCELSNNLISTDEDMCHWEDQTMHDVSDVPMELRNTLIEFQHSEILQEQIYARVRLCRAYMNDYLKEVLTDHNLIAT